MNLKLYDTKTKSKQSFTPRIPGKVSLYVCGVTTYDYCHIGHARTFVCFDILVRYLTALGFEVKYVRNITDIDDKIIQTSKKQNKNWKALVAEMTLAMREDFKQLNLLPPTVEPFATEHITEMQNLITQLLEKNFAYETTSGDVFFSVNRCENYGALSGQTTSQLRASQQHTSKDKLDAPDFALWKAAKPDEPSWESPWGTGRPGWHIECSAMSQKWLGDNFDIHGGGGDLLFPHHENEMAQSTCASGSNFANLWLHTGMVTVNDIKMSKSLHNFLTIREALEVTDPESLRFFLGSSHYRSALIYSTAALSDAKKGLKRLYTALAGRNLSTTHSDSLCSEFKKAFHEAMNDDLNTPKAYSILFELAHEIQKLKHKNEDQADSLASLLKQLANFLGLLERDPKLVLQGTTTEAFSHSEAIQSAILARNLARSKGQYEKADKIRSDLLKQGIILEDHIDGTSWRLE